MTMTTENRIIHLLGYASDLAGVGAGCAAGPIALQQSTYLKLLPRSKIHFNWDVILQSVAAFPGLSEEFKKTEMKNTCQQLALHTADLARKKEFFIVIGGDHASAIGTWSGVYAATHEQGPFGLIWIDAHMDSHTPETSQSGRLHGMPVACLLGQGDQRFTQLLSPSPKIKPAYLCLIGVRSYEKEEEAFLRQQNVRVFFMEEVEKRGLPAIFDEALSIVTSGTIGYGVSVDVDVLDPLDAPGVDVPESGGILLQELSQVLRKTAHDPRLLGAEVVEYNPSQDLEKRTEQAVVELIAALAGVF